MTARARTHRGMYQRRQRLFRHRCARRTGPSLPSRSGPVSARALKGATQRICVRPTARPPIQSPPRRRRRRPAAARSRQASIGAESRQRGSEQHENREIPNEQEPAWPDVQARADDQREHLHEAPAEKRFGIADSRERQQQGCRGGREWTVLRVVHGVGHVDRGDSEQHQRGGFHAAARTADLPGCRRAPAPATPRKCLLYGAGAWEGFNLSTRVRAPRTQDSSGARYRCAPSIGSINTGDAPVSKTKEGAAPSHVAEARPRRRRNPSRRHGDCRQQGDGHDYACAARTPRARSGITLRRRRRVYSRWLTRVSNMRR